MSQAGDKRERLLEAGRRLMHRQGFRHTTLADIAHESGVPLGNVYYYFKTKEELLSAVARRLGEEFDRAAAQLEARSRDPRERLLAFLDAVVVHRSTFAEHGCPLGSLSQEANKDSCGVRETVNRALVQRAEWAAKQFRLMGRADAGELGIALIASMQGVALMANAMHDSQVVARQVARMKQWVREL